MKKNTNTVVKQKPATKGRKTSYTSAKKAAKKAGSNKKPTKTKKAEPKPEVPEKPAKPAYSDATWYDFRQSGLLLFVNLFLHIFGWCIVCRVDESGNINKVYPARTCYRGFSEGSISSAYIKLSEFISKNHKRLLDEARS